MARMARMASHRLPAAAAGHVSMPRHKAAARQPRPQFCVPIAYSRHLLASVSLTTPVENKNPVSPIPRRSPRYAKRCRDQHQPPRGSCCPAACRPAQQRSCGSGPWQRAAPPLHSAGCQGQAAGAGDRRDLQALRRGKFGTGQHSLAVLKGSRPVSGMAAAVRRGRAQPSFL